MASGLWKKPPTSYRVFYFLCLTSKKECKKRIADEGATAIDWSQGGSSPLSVQKILRTLGGLIVKRKFTAFSLVLGLALLTGACASGGNSGETQPNDATNGTSGVEAPSGTQGTDSVAPPTGASDTQSPSGMGNSASPSGTSNTESPSGVSDSASPSGASDAESSTKSDEKSTKSDEKSTKSDEKASESETKPSTSAP